MITLLNYLLISTAFGGAFLLPSSLAIEFPVNYFFIVIFLAYYVYRFRRIDVNRNFFIIIMALALVSLVKAGFGNTTVLLLSKQLFGITFTGIGYYLLIKINNYDVQRIFKTYFVFAFIVAILGVVQEASFLLKFKYGYDLHYIMRYTGISSKWAFSRADCGLLRINSVFMEPAHFAITMAPAFFVSLCALVSRKSFLHENTKAVIAASCVIVVSYFLTFSTVAYIATLVSVIMIVARYIRSKSVICVSISALLMLTYASYAYVPEFRERTNAVMALIREPDKHVHLNLSVFALTSNAVVAYQSLKNDPLFGSGLGSHPVSYDKFMSTPEAKIFLGGYAGAINKNDACSLLVRLFSETGLLGVIMAIYFVIRYRLKLKENDSLPVISHAILVLFIVQLLRQGHYFYNGFLLFGWLYYFSNRIYNKEKSFSVSKENGQDHCRISG